MVGVSLGDKGATMGGYGRRAESRSRERGMKMVFYCSDSFSLLGSLGPSIPLTSLLTVRFAGRQEPVSSPWCKNLTLGCPAKAEGPA